MRYKWHLGDGGVDQSPADVEFYSAADASVRDVHVTHGNVLFQRRRRAAACYIANVGRATFIQDSCPA